MNVTHITVPVALAVLLAGCAASPAGPGGGGTGGSDGSGGDAPAPASRADCTDELIDLITQGHPEGYTRTEDVELPDDFGFVLDLAPGCVFVTTSENGEGDPFDDYVIGYTDVSQDEGAQALAELQSVAQTRHLEASQLDSDYMGDDYLAGNWTSVAGTPNAEVGHMELEVISPLGSDFAKATGLPEDSGFMSIELDLPAT